MRNLLNPHPIVLKRDAMRNPVREEELGLYVNYDPTTGYFTHARYRRPWGCHPAKFIGERAETEAHGYLYVWVYPRRYPAAQLAWFFVHGRWPKDEPDHINGKPGDNRIDNLREATHQQNMWNRARMSNAPDLPRGVSFHKRAGKYQAKIKVNQKQRYLGLYATPEEASAAYEKAANEAFGSWRRVA